MQFPYWSLLTKFCWTSFRHRSFTRGRTYGSGMEEKLFHVRCILRLKLKATAKLVHYRDDFLSGGSSKKLRIQPSCPSCITVVASCNQLTALNHTYAGKETAKRCLVGCSAELKAMLWVLTCPVQIFALNLEVRVLLFFFFNVVFLCVCVVIKASLD